MFENLSPLHKEHLSLITHELQAEPYARLLIQSWVKLSNHRSADQADDRPAFAGYRRFGTETWHEEIFSAWFPLFDRQVTFGTGPGGMTKYGSHSFTVDFFDGARNEVYELDGPSHRTGRQKISDQNKDRFLAGKKIRVFRYPLHFIEEHAVGLLARVFERMGHMLRGEPIGFMQLPDERWIRPLLKMYAQTSDIPFSPGPGPGYSIDKFRRFGGPGFYALLTGDPDLATTPIPIPSFLGGVLPAAISQFVPMSKWVLFRDGEQQGDPHDITHTVLYDIYCIVLKHYGKSPKYRKHRRRTRPTNFAVYRLHEPPVITHHDQDQWARTYLGQGTAR